MKRTKKQITSILLAAVMVIASLAIMPIKALAEDAVTINISTLGNSNDDNSSTPTKSQWTYDGTNKVLTLLTAHGSYTLINTNSELRVIVDAAATDANVILDNVEMNATVGQTFAICNKECTVTLVGNNTLSNNCTAFSSCLNVEKSCTITGNGEVTVIGSAIDCAVALNSNVNLAITGNAKLSAIPAAISSAEFTMACHGNNTIFVEPTARLYVSGSEKGLGVNLLDHDKNFTLNCDGAAGILAGSSNGMYAYPSSSIILSGSGYVDVVGSLTEPAINTDQPILMSDDITLTMINNNTGNVEKHLFQKSSTATTHQWKLTNATTTDPLTDDSINIEVAPEMHGMVAREMVASGAKNIIGFSIPEQFGSTTISGTAISLTVSGSTDVTNLTPTIMISADATVNPASGVAQDFTTPVTYTVTAADLSTQVYTVTVAVDVNLPPAIKPETEPAVYTIDVQTDGHGSALANVAAAAAGTEITLTSAPNSGYQFKEWQIVAGTFTITNNKFTMPAENVTVKAIFQDIPETKKPNDTNKTTTNNNNHNNTTTITNTTNSGYPNYVAPSTGYTGPVAPKTGDNSTALPWMILGISSLGLIGLVVLFLKRRGHQQ